MVIFLYDGLLWIIFRFPKSDLGRVDLMQVRLEICLKNWLKVKTNKINGRFCLFLFQTITHTLS